MNTATPAPAPPSPEDGPRTAPLNLSKKQEAEPAAEHAAAYGGFAEPQEVPLNLSVKDPCNAWPSVHSPPRRAEAATPAPAPRQPDPSGSTEAGDARTTDSDEQKQTAAVALCQLAAYSPGKVCRGEGEPEAREPAAREPAPRSLESREAPCDLRPKGPKRTSPRDAGHTLCLALGQRQLLLSRCSFSPWGRHAVPLLQWDTPGRITSLPVPVH